LTFGDASSRLCVGLGETKVWAAHLTFGPALKIGDREVLEKRVGFYQSLPFSSASRIGIYEDERASKVSGAESIATAPAPPAKWAK
jgi:hypothetical protein